MFFAQPHAVARQPSAPLGLRTRHDVMEFGRVAQAAWNATLPEIALPRDVTARPLLLRVPLFRAQLGNHARFWFWVGEASVVHQSFLSA